MGKSPVALENLPLLGDRSPPINVTIHSVYKAPEIQGFKPMSEGYFLVAKMTVENRGDSDYVFNEKSVRITNGQLSVPQLYRKLNGFTYWDVVPAHSTRTRQVLFGTDKDTQNFTLTFYYNKGKSSFTKDLGYVPLEDYVASSAAANAEDTLQPVRVILHSAYKTPSIGDSKPYSGKIFVVTNVTIENQGDTNYTFNEASVALTGGGPLTQKLYSVLDNPFYWGTVPAQGSTTGEVVFSVPISTQQLTLTFLDSGGKIIFTRDISNITEKT